MKKKRAIGGEAPAAPKPKLLRCAVYTRKSTDEKLDVQVNSLEVQREHAEQYIASQAGNGWLVLPEHYDDGGWTGANTERPAFQRLMRDIDAGLIDCVVVYKLDRLSRSLVDCLRVFERFEQRGITFVSVTQSFNTNDSTGRLLMHILLSFAQFEREQIVERIRHKMSALRSKGKWVGGRPILGYDIAANPVGAGYLVVNREEAAQALELFECYDRTGSLIAAARFMNERGYRTKRWISASHKSWGGRRFDKTIVHALLRNRLYRGEIDYKGEIVCGEHEAIVPPELWDRVNERLRRQRRARRTVVRGGGEATPLLRGLVQCKACGRPLVPVRSGNSKGHRYLSYTCNGALKEGFATCPVKGIPAAELERFVVDQLRSIAYDPAFREEIVTRAQDAHQADLERLEADVAAGERRLALLEGRLKRAGHTPGRELLEEHAAAQAGLVSARAALTSHPPPPTAAELVAATAEYDPVWGELTPEEQQRMVRLLVETVVIDGENQRVAMKFRAAGFRQLGQLRAADN